MLDPNQYSFYKYYHIQGANFARDVGRKWSLNESGKYTLPPAWARGKSYKKGDLVNNGSNTYRAVLAHWSDLWNCPPNGRDWELTAGYDRGLPFNFSGVIPAEYILDEDGKRLFAPFNRRLLPALTVDKNSLSSIGIKVEFSFDAGCTWQTVKAAIENLDDECGIYIAEPNLSEIYDQNNSKFLGEPFDGKLINFWASLADDKLSGRSFKNGDWFTRVRVTASIALDRRLARQAAVDPSTSGSPFHHSQVYDFSAKYGLKKRTAASQYYGSSLPAWNVNDRDWCDKHLGGIRRANEDASISGAFTLERLWLGDGRGTPDFAIGDCIEKIEGREHSLSTSFCGKNVYPEIIKIIYLPDKQKMQLITRDLRFAAEVVL